LFIYISHFGLFSFITLILHSATPENIILSHYNTSPHCEQAAVAKLFPQFFHDYAEVRQAAINYLCSDLGRELVNEVVYGSLMSSRDLSILLNQIRNNAMYLK
jgi:hypothetical protein